jgi:hypothetical protein
MVVINLHIRRSIWRAVGVIAALGALSLLLPQGWLDRLT